MSRAATPLPAAGLMARLREATAAEHRAVEQRLPLTRAGVTLDDYRDYLARMWTVHAPVEAQLDALPALRAIVPDFAERRRRPQLEQDLAALGVDLATLGSRPPVVVPPLDLPAALGALYVLEGSTLGGQLLRRHLTATLGAPVAAAARYLGAYDDVGAMWRRFRGAVDDWGAAHPEATAAVVGGARAMFRRIGDCLGGGGARA